MEPVHKIIAMGYSIIIIIVVGIAYIWYCEWQDVESLEADYRQINKFRTEINDIHRTGLVLQPNISPELQNRWRSMNTGNSMRWLKRK